MNQKRPETLLSFFSRRRGIAIFMAALILLSVSILSLSTMTRISETSQHAAQALAARKMALIADAAVRVALADIVDQFFNVPGSPDTIFVNKTNSANDPNPRLLVDRSGGDPGVPLFAYRAAAHLLLVGDNTTILPGTEFPVSANYTCYHVMVDSTELLPLGAGVQSDAGSPPGYSGYYYGARKSVGITTCLKKRNN